MSIKHPIISVTGSSGAGTTSVWHTFENIFRRESVNAAFVQGDAFHRFERGGMDKAMADAAKRGNQNFSHFGDAANLLEDLEAMFRSYAETGRGRTARRSSPDTRPSSRAPPPAGRREAKPPLSARCGPPRATMAATPAVPPGRP